MGIDQWVDKEPKYEDTLNLKKMIGVNVLSKRGIHLGKVVEVRTDPQSLACYGILVKPGIFGKPRYFSTKYVERFSLAGIVLSVEPVYLLMKRKVITSDGKVIGKVREIERIDSTNQVRSIKIKSLFRKEKTISSENIKTLGVSIMLKEGYQAEKKVE